MEARKRKQKIRVYINNLLMVSVVIGIVSVLVLITQGWTFDQKGVEQTGLVQFASNPTGATVEIGEKTLYTKSNTKANVSPGSHEFNVWREGYETWFKKKDVSAGQLLWFNYVRLIPKNKMIKNVLEFDNLKQNFTFPNQQKMLILSETNEGAPILEILDLRGDSPKKINLKLQTDLFDLDESETNSSENLRGQFKIVEISNDNAHAIFQRKSKTKTEWVLLDLNDMNKSQNLTREFNIDFGQTEFVSDNGSRILVKTSDNLRRLNTDNKTISASLANNVIDFSVYKKDVGVFTQKIKGSDKLAVGVLKVDADKPFISKIQLEADSQIKIGRYYDENYLHVITDKKLTIYKNEIWPTKGNDFSHYKTIELPFSPEIVQLNLEGRLVALTKSDRVFTYDLELSENHEMIVNNDAKTSSKVSWLDNFVMFGNENNTLTIRDFDGANKHKLMKASAKFSAMLSENNKFIYAFEEQENGKVKLNQLKMIID